MVVPDHVGEDVGERIDLKSVELFRQSPQPDMKSILDRHRAANHAYQVTGRPSARPSPGSMTPWLRSLGSSLWLESGRGSRSSAYSALVRARTMINFPVNCNHPGKVPEGGTASKSRESSELIDNSLNYNQHDGPASWLVSGCAFLSGLFLAWEEGVRPGLDRGRGCLPSFGLSSLVRPSGRQNSGN